MDSSSRSRPFQKIPQVNLLFHLNFFNALSHECLGDIAIGVIVLLIGIGFGVAALGDFLLVVRVKKLFS